MAGGDHLRQPVEHDPVVGGHDPGHDSAINPGAALDIVVPDRPADDARDDVGDLGHRERFGAGGRVRRASVRVGVDQRLDGDRGDVRGVDERLSAACCRHRDRVLDDGQVFVAEVLHHPRGAQDRRREGLPAHEFEFDGPDVDLRRGLVAAVGAEVGDVPNGGGFGEIQEVGHQAGVGDPHDGCDEVDEVDTSEGGTVRGRVVPVERQIGAVPRRCPRDQAPFGEFPCHQ